MRKIWVVGAALALAFTNTTPAHAIELPKSFARYATSPALGNAGIILLDPTTHEPVFEDQPDSLRAPASVLKLLSATTAIRVLGPDKTYKTASYRLDSKTFALVGEGDPWLTTSKKQAAKDHRAFTPYLINKILQTNPNLRSITLKTRGVYKSDLKAIQQYFKGRLVIHTRPFTVDEAALLNETQKLGEINSPTVADIVKFTLLWSDNVLADRLARTAAKKMGFATDETGIQSAFESTLTSLEVPTTGLQVFDGNGLSHENRVSPRKIGRAHV